MLTRRADPADAEAPDARPAADLTGEPPVTESRGSFRLIYRSRDLIPSDRRKAGLGELFSAP